MKENAFEATAVCDNCGKLILVNSSTIKRKEIKCLSNEKRMTAIFYKCEDCGRICVVQIDDVTTKGLLNKLTKGVAKMARCKKHNEMISEKEMAKITKIRTDLADKRTALIKKYQGKECIFEDGSKFILKVSVQNGDKEIKPN